MISRAWHFVCSLSKHCRLKRRGALDLAVHHGKAAVWIVLHQAVLSIAVFTPTTEEDSWLRLLTGPCFYRLIKSVACVVCLWLYSGTTESNVSKCSFFLTSLLSVKSSVQLCIFCLGQHTAKPKNIFTFLHLASLFLCHLQRDTACCSISSPEVD